jgi:hypothetical protein
MSDVMTSRSMPSRGTKYSFWRGAAGGIGCVWLDLLLGLPAIVELCARSGNPKNRNRKKIGIQSPDNRIWRPKKEPGRDSERVVDFTEKTDENRRCGRAGKIGEGIRAKEGRGAERTGGPGRNGTKGATKPGAWGWAVKVGHRCLAEWLVSG